MTSLDITIVECQLCLAILQYHLTPQGMCYFLQFSKPSSSSSTSSSFYALPFANDTTDDHFSDIPEIAMPSNVDDDGRSPDGTDIKSDEFNWLAFYTY